MDNKIKKVMFFRTDCIDPYKNIAMEYRLVQACPNDAVVVFVWQNDHSVIIGKNQNAFSEVNVSTLLADGGKLVRRFTGGGAVYHDVKNLNFSFIAPKGVADVKQNFKVVTNALKKFGINAEISGRNDLTVDGRKFSGNAFLNEQKNSLHHGTILIDTNVDKMQKYLNVSEDKLRSKGVKSVSSRVVNLSTICPTITASAVAESLSEVCGEVYGAKRVDATLDQLPWAGESDTEKTLRSNEWIFGRIVDESFCTARNRFDWGGVEVAYLFDGNKIKDLLVFSDCLDTDICLLATKTLVGKTLDEAKSLALSDDRLKDITSLLA